MSVEVERVKNRIRLTSTRPTPGLSQTVPGASWSKSGKFWSIPLSLEHCLALRDRFGAELHIGPDLWVWAKEERARRAELDALGRSSEVGLRRVPKVAPGLYEAMQTRPYQTVAADFIALGRRVLIGDHPGLGKTLEAIAGVIESGQPGPYLVVAPKTAVESVWAREIPRWWPDATVTTLPDNRPGREKKLAAFAAEAGPNDWLVINPEVARTSVWWVCKSCGSETRRRPGKVELVCGETGHRIRVDHAFPGLFTPQFGAVILDESDRSLVRLKATGTLARVGMELLPVRADGLRVAMSGTPFRSRPHLLWGTLNWLDPERYSAMWSWIQTYWDVQVGGWTGTQHTIGKLRADREERLWDSLTPILLRRTKDEVAPDLPPKQYMGSPLYPGSPDSAVGVWLEMDPKQAKAHRDMTDNSVADLESGEISAIGVLAELTRLKQFADCYGTMVEVEQKYSAADEARLRRTRTKRGLPQPTDEELQTSRYEFRPALPSNKFDWLCNFLDQMGFPEAPQGKVVVASQFTAVLNLFAEELRRGKRGERSPIPSVMLTGEVTGSRRTDVIDAMNRPVGEGAHLMFLNTKAGGVAITLDYADDMVILDETWIPDDQEQLEDRIHRVSRPRPVRYHYLRSVGSVEEGIAAVNSARREDSARVLDGRRGIEILQAIR
jgi:hypothetical protein